MQKLAKILLMTLLWLPASMAAAEPMGYSINSDSPSDTGTSDSLYRIDLGSGTTTRIGSVTSFGLLFTDVEGLAISPDGTLYGVDDDYMRLFPINTSTGQVRTQNEVSIADLPFGGKNDFGMTFTCGGELYITSVTRRSLYRLELNGDTDVVGTSEGLLGANISAIAAYGENPVVLYGLGNGLDDRLNKDAPSLFRIDIDSGIASEIGPLGPSVADYAEAGLAFDDEGQLWAVTDRRDSIGGPLTSQIVRINKTTGAAISVRNSDRVGLESLAITVPRGCEGGGTQSAEFRVEKQFADGNEDINSTLNVSCDAGFPREQSFTTQPGSGVEAIFTVSDFQDGALDCHVWETPTDEYTATHECFSTGDCSATAESCHFTSVSLGQSNLCVITNYPKSVNVTVATDWIENLDLPFPIDSVAVELICQNLLGGDGEWRFGEMHWSFVFAPDSPDQVVTIQPNSIGTTECSTIVKAETSAVEVESDCRDWTNVFTGGAPLTCTVTNAVFFEGIPTLNRGGLILATLLMLLTGMVFVRRF